MDRERKLPLVTLPVPSTSFTAETVLEYPCYDGSLQLRFQFDFEGERQQAILAFHGVRAHSHRSEGVCTAWHVDGAYDTLAEVLDSSWLREVKRLSMVRGYPGWESYHHFMIYVDSSGCYEVIARSWNLTAPAPIGP